MGTADGVPPARHNAELDLARHLNAYLADNDEYRAITRNLLHLGGRIAFARRRVTVTLDRPLPPGGKDARPAPRRARCRIPSPSGKRPATIVYQMAR
jgi:hypothetical protein